MYSGNGGEILHRRRERGRKPGQKSIYNEIKLGKKCNFGTMQDCLTLKLKSMVLEIFLSRGCPKTKARGPRRPGRT